MRLETTVINCLKEKYVEVREGHQGTFSSVARLWTGGSYRINLDLNATYRKYMIVGPDDRKKILSSDDIIEHSVVKVVESSDEPGWTLELLKRPPTRGWLSKLLGRSSSD